RKLKKALGYLYMYMRDMVTKPDFDLCLDNSFAIISSGKQRADSVGKRLRNLRTGRALTAGKASALLGIKEERMRKIEEGKESPDAGEIRRICGVFGVSYETLLDGIN
ncbi:MAG: helix-turn-helix transcriptional regulator, partial [Clostridia bacterium]|nr:helix-turn-helix transcriptional regulator [Clostridia bacterium]